MGGHSTTNTMASGSLKPEAGPHRNILSTNQLTKQIDEGRPSYSFNSSDAQWSYIHIYLLRACNRT